MNKGETMDPKESAEDYLETILILSKKLPPASIVVKLSIHAVIVVPTLAPIMIAAAWTKDITPALTRPIAKEDVALDDWIAAVKPAPVRQPKNLFEEHLLIILESFLDLFQCCVV